MKTKRTPQEEIKRLKSVVAAKTLAMKQHAKGHRRLHRKLNRSKADALTQRADAASWRENAEAFQKWVGRLRKELDDLKRQINLNTSLSNVALTHAALGEAVYDTSAFLESLKEKQDKLAAILKNPQA